MSQIRRTSRVSKRKVIWEQSTILPDTIHPKKTKKKHVETLETAAATQPVPREVQEALDQSIIDFTPPVQVGDDLFEVLWKEQEPIDLFIKFLGGEQALDTIILATNERANATNPRQENSRPWEPLTRTTLLKWLRTLFFMGIHKE